MKVVEKLALGTVIALLLCCLACIAVLWFTDFGTDFFQASSEIAAAARALNALDEKFPFEPPEGAGIPQERLAPYFEASCASKPEADALQAHIDEHGTVRVAGQPIYKGEGAKLMTAYMTALTAALDEARMGPEEFNWIHQRLRLASKGPPSDHDREKMRETLETLRTIAQDPQAGEKQRAEMRRHIELLETLPDAWGPVAQADYALFHANVARIQSCGHGNRAVHAMSELLVAASGKTRTYIEVDPEEMPEAPAPPAPPSPPEPPPR